jgi:DNA-binding MarR family transcriptional regulator
VAIVGEQRNMFLDNELKLMSEISENENITQRELSKRLNLSLGSVNLLIKKMIKEGLIKMNQVSKRQVFYILTPTGMMEKAKKTSKYIKIHYNAINETKKSIKRTLEEISKEYDTIYILKSESEINQVLDAAVDEYLGKGMNFDIRIVDINQKTNINDKKSSVLLYLSEDEEEVKEYKNIDKLDIVNLLERI